MNTVSVHDRALDRQANNLPVEVLAEAVRPWFDMWQGSVQVQEAIDGLASEHTRAASARFLGLELRTVA